MAGDEAVLALLDEMPEPKRQPNLLFGVVRLLGGPVEDPGAFHEFVVSMWPTVMAQMLARTTQSNEPGRCALLLPLFGRAASALGAAGGRRLSWPVSLPRPDGDLRRDSTAFPASDWAR